MKSPLTTRQILLFASTLAMLTYLDRVAFAQAKPEIAHDLALTNGAGPRLHHLAYWMPDGARIFQLCDALAGAHMESHIERGPGRHGISNALFLYLRDPDGHRIELFDTHYQCMDIENEPVRWDLSHAAMRRCLPGAPRC